MGHGSRDRGVWRNGKKAFWEALMKNYVFGLALFAVSLVSSISMAGDDARPDISPAHSSDNDSALNKVPEKARARVNPFRNDPDAVVAGQILFEDHCLACHGPEGVRGQEGTKSS